MSVNGAHAFVGEIVDSRRKFEFPTRVEGAGLPTTTYYYYLSTSTTCTTIIHGIIMQFQAVIPIDGGWMPPETSCVASSSAVWGACAMNTIVSSIFISSIAHHVQVFPPSLRIDVALSFTAMQYVMMKQHSTDILVVSSFLSGPCWLICLSSTFALVP